MDVLREETRRHRKEIHIQGPLCFYVLRGDMKQSYEVLDPRNLYAPVATHKALRLFLSVVASEGLIMEAADVNNA